MPHFASSLQPNFADDRQHVTRRTIMYRTRTHIRNLAVIGATFFLGFTPVNAQIYTGT